MATDTRCKDCGDPLRAHHRESKFGQFACAVEWAWDEEIGWYDSAGSGCPCNAYVPRIPDPAKQKRGRNNRKRGLAAQRKANLAAGFAHRTGHGCDGVYYAPDGSLLLVGESKRKRAMPPAEIEKALQQAEAYAVHERGRPKACLLWTTVPGMGKKGAMYLIFRADEWPGFAESMNDA